MDRAVRLTWRLCRTGCAVQRQDYSGDEGWRIQSNRRIEVGVCAAQRPRFFRAADCLLVATHSQGTVFKPTGVPEMDFDRRPPRTVPFTSAPSLVPPPPPSIAVPTAPYVPPRVVPQIPVGFPAASAAAPHRPTAADLRRYEAAYGTAANAPPPPVWPIAHDMIHDRRVAPPPPAPPDSYAVWPSFPADHTAHVRLHDGPPAAAFGGGAAAPAYYYPPHVPPETAKPGSAGHFGLGLPQDFMPRRGSRSAGFNLLDPPPQRRDRIGSNERRILAREEAAVEEPLRRQRIVTHEEETEEPMRPHRHIRVHDEADEPHRGPMASAEISPPEALRKELALSGGGSSAHRKYIPYSLGDFKEINRPVKLGSLGPDLQNEELLAKVRCPLRRGLLQWYPVLLPS